MRRGLNFLSGKIILSPGSNSCKLPNENELAAYFRVNRGTLRQALAILEYEGYIVRKQKVGTFLNPHIAGIGVRLEDITGILQQIQNFGFTARVEFENFSYMPASIQNSKKLGICEGSVLLCSQAKFFADDLPAAFVRDWIPIHLIQKPMDIQNPGTSIFDFLDNYCNSKVKHEISEIIPIQCDLALSEILQLPLARLLIQINSVVFDQNNDPVMLSELIFNDRYFNFSVIRRFIST